MVGWLEPVWEFDVVALTLNAIEILTRGSNKLGLTKPITRSDRFQLTQTHGTNDMTHRIKSNRTKPARAHTSACPNRQNTQACD